MKALITGASSGLGRDMARILASYGIDLVIVARRGERLQELKEELIDQVAVTTVCLDLSKAQNCRMLYEKFRHEQIDILINNAGFGLAVFARFHRARFRLYAQCCLVRSFSARSINGRILRYQGLRAQLNLVAA